MRVRVCEWERVRERRPQRRLACLAESRTKERETGRKSPRSLPLLTHPVTRGWSGVRRDTERKQFEPMPGDRCSHDIRLAGGCVPCAHCALYIENYDSGTYPVINPPTPPPSGMISASGVFCARTVRAARSRANAGLTPNPVLTLNPSTNMYPSFSGLTQCSPPPVSPQSPACSLRSLCATY